MARRDGRTMRDPVAPAPERRRRRFNRIRQLTQAVFLGAGISAALMVSHFAADASATATQRAISNAAPSPTSRGDGAPDASQTRAATTVVSSKVVTVRHPRSQSSSAPSRRVSHTSATRPPVARVTTPTVAPPPTPTTTPPVAHPTTTIPSVTPTTVAVTTPSVCSTTPSGKKVCH